MYGNNRLKVNCLELLCRRPSPARDPQFSVLRENAPVCGRFAGRRRACKCATPFRGLPGWTATGSTDRKSTRLNSSHVEISYAVFCLKKKKKSIVIEVS